MSTLIIKKRLKTVRQQLKEKGVDALLIAAGVNVSYLSGFLGDDSWLLVGARNIYLLTDSRYTEQAARQCLGCKIIERSGPMAEAVAKLLAGLSSVKKLGVENCITLAQFQAVKKAAKVRLKPLAGIVEASRSIKDSGEVALIKKAAQIAQSALKKVQKKIETAMTESEVAGMLNFEMRKAGATNSFETIVAFGANGSMAHYRPGARKLKNDDSILIDFGANFKGYCSDITRCFTRGKVSEKYKTVYKAVQAAQDATIAKVKAGVKIRDVDAAAREILKKYNLPIYGHGTGHGLGMEVHEGPFVTKNVKGKLQAGQVITIEPGVYIPGKLGIRIEDDVLVTPTGCICLTKRAERNLQWMKD